MDNVCIIPSTHKPTKSLLTERKKKNLKTGKPDKCIQTSVLLVMVSNKAEQVYPTGPYCQLSYLRGIVRNLTCI